VAIDTPVDLEIRKLKLLRHLWCDSYAQRECSRLGRNEV